MIYRILVKLNFLDDLLLFSLYITRSQTGSTNYFKVQTPILHALGPSIWQESYKTHLFPLELATQTVPSNSDNCGQQMLFP